MNIKTITRYGLLMSIMIVSTLIIKIPAPNQMGYLNLSDFLIIMSVVFIPKPSMAFAAGLALLLTDIFAGYGQYAVFTFLVKSIEGLIIVFFFKAKKEITIKQFGMISLLAVVVMVLGYGLSDAIIFQGISYIWPSILVNLPQAGFAWILSIVCYRPMLKVFSQIER